MRLETPFEFEGVLVPASIAGELYRALRGVNLSREARAAVQSLGDCAARFAERSRASKNGSTSLPKSEAVLSLWLTATEAAEVLDLTQRRVIQLLRCGDLEGQKRGNAWSISEASVSELLARRMERTD